MTFEDIRNMVFALIEDEPEDEFFIHHLNMVLAEISLTMNLNESLPFYTLEEKPGDYTRPSLPAVPEVIYADEDYNGVSKLFIMNMIVPKVAESITITDENDFLAFTNKDKSAMAQSQIWNFIDKHFFYTGILDTANFAGTFSMDFAENAYMPMTDSSLDWN